MPFTYHEEKTVHRFYKFSELTAGLSEGYLLTLNRHRANFEQDWQPDTDDQQVTVSEFLSYVRDQYDFDPADPSIIGWYGDDEKSAIFGWCDMVEKECTGEIIDITL